ncbi:MAG: hypothetical protein GX089_15350 [Fibrobacter sp.]|nr:hypothetical protein [Fibrobacter sp.]
MGTGIYQCRTLRLQWNNVSYVQTISFKKSSSFILLLLEIIFETADPLTPR